MNRACAWSIIVATARLSIGPAPPGTPALLTLA
jgi:hypothetical protein